MTSDGYWVRFSRESERSLNCLPHARRHRQLDWLWSRQGRRGRAHEGLCPSLCPSGHAGDRGPGLEGLGSGGSILDGGAVIAAEVEQVVDLIVSGEEALGLAGRLEALHLPLPSSGRLMGILRPVVQAFMSSMLDPRHDLLLCGPVARQLVCDHNTGRAHLLL